MTSILCNVLLHSIVDAGCFFFFTKVLAIFRHTTHVLGKSIACGPRCASRGKHFSHGQARFIRDIAHDWTSVSFSSLDKKTELACVVTIAVRQVLNPEHESQLLSRYRGDFKGREGCWTGAIDVFAVTFLLSKPPYNYFYWFPSHFFQA
jgi:hypothetical protein